MKKKGRRAIEEKSVTVDNVDVRAVQWFDNKIVTLDSSHAACKPITKVKRFFKSDNTRKEMDCPDIVGVYNRHIDGVAHKRARAFFPKMSYEIQSIKLGPKFLMHKGVT